MIVLLNSFLKPVTFFGLYKEVWVTRFLNIFIVSYLSKKLNRQLYLNDSLLNSHLRQFRGITPRSLSSLFSSKYKSLLFWFLLLTSLFVFGFV